MSTPATKTAGCPATRISDPGGQGVFAAVPVTASHSHWPLAARPDPARSTSAHGL